MGRLVAQRLRSLVSANVCIEEQDGAATQLLERLRGAGRVWLIDAAASGAPAGTIHRIDCAAGAPLPARPGASSHGLGVAEAIALARLLYGQPRLCTLYAVEGVAFAPGAGMSPPVLAAAEALAAQLAEELATA